MVADDRGQLLLLGGLAMAIVFLAAIPLSNSLVVTESAATSDTVRKIDQTADREAAVVRSIQTIANRTDAADNPDEFNRTLQNYSAHRLRVAGQQSGVFVNATLNRSASARRSESTIHDSGDDWTLSEHSGRIYEFDITVRDSPFSPGLSEFTVTIASESSAENWQLTVREQPDDDVVVTTSESGGTYCEGTTVQIDIRAGTCTEGGSTETLGPTYRDTVTGPYTVTYDDTSGWDADYTVVATGEFPNTASDLAIPYVDVTVEGPDASYTRTISTEETE